MQVDSAGPLIVLQLLGDSRSPECPSEKPSQKYFKLFYLAFSKLGFHQSTSVVPPSTDLKFDSSSVNFKIVLFLHLHLTS
jgi:hypothetical protein